MSGYRYTTQGYVEYCSGQPKQINDPIVENFQVSSCSKPKTWCTHKNSTLKQVDCRGDGNAGDFVCYDADGSIGFIKRDNCCNSTWPYASFDSCSKAKYQLPSSFQCPRPKNWCVHKGSTFKVADCTGSGFGGDLVCTDTAGSKGLVSRNAGCQSQWPNADISKCKYSS